MSLLVVFAHGKDSTPWGTKITHLAAIAKKHGALSLSPDHSSMDNPDSRIKHLLSIPELKDPKYSKIVLVGSSMGGYVSCVASQTIKPTGMFLLAPAFGITWYPVQYPEPGCTNVEIVMGWQDETISVQNVVDFGAKYKTKLHLLNSDHRLQNIIPELEILFDNFLINLK
ncbi:hypothetical protein TI05_11910 [Achromatium sp. WMS3]|nr:hypothetical protein TI05_11910 [Achromatium sp. WMS3]